MKWYHKLWSIFVLIILLPFLLIALVGYAVFIKSFLVMKERSAYKKSSYYRDLKVPYKKGITRKVFYRAYTAFKEMGVVIQYIRQEFNHFEFFIHQGTVYFLPDFDELRYFREKDEWAVVYRKYSEEGSMSLQRYLDSCLDLLEKEYKDLPTRLIVERNLVSENDLTGKTVPYEMFIIRDYETAFDDAQTAFLTRFPQSAKELYELLMDTPDLCGQFELIGDEIYWEYKDLSLSIAPEYISVGGLTHWHPSEAEIYDDVCAITRSGSVLVIKKSSSSSQVLYIGKKEKCPYFPNQKGVFSKIYYFEME